MALIYPADDPEGWNGLTIQGERVPGYVEFPEGTIARKIDEKPSPGSEVFALTDKGPNCADIKITFLLTQREHFADFEGIYKLYLDPRRPLTKRNVVSVVHPSLYFAGIRQGYFYSTDLLRPTAEGRSFYKLASKFKEFNDKTKIGGGGSKKVKADLSSIGKAAKWSNSGVNLPAAVQEAALQGAREAAAKAAAQSKPVAKTHRQLRKDAAAGNPSAAFIARALDGKAK